MSPALPRHLGPDLGPGPFALPPAPPRGLLVSAPASGTGKTTVTLGLARALVRRGQRVQCFKSGPDYIDPAFHRQATGRLSVNLDSWAMAPGLIGGLIARAIAADAADAATRNTAAILALAEGSMGLHDGVARAGATGTGASADLAELTGWPLVLVLDGSGQAQSAGAVALGLARFRPGLHIAGVVVNRVASPRHQALLRQGIEAAGLTWLGALPRQAAIALPERHLGLVQAEEQPGLDRQIEAMADLIEAHLDLQSLTERAHGAWGGALANAPGAPTLPATAPSALPPPPGQRIALARDAAFSFSYPHLLQGWRDQGAEILPFSPLANEPPPPAADACWLPGGYPELHAGALAAADRFRQGLRAFGRDRPVHGECGGYMVLGAGLVDAQGQRHQMAGLLGLETSFAKRRMHLGYRQAQLCTGLAGLAPGQSLVGHEFHYATILAQPDAPLAVVRCAQGLIQPETGSLRRAEGGGQASGSFFHLIALGQALDPSLSEE